MNNYAHLVISERKLAFWDSEINQKNLDFINMLEPEYFKFLAKVNFDILNSDNHLIKEKQFAAMNLKAIYSQGLETLFSLLFATVQAPDCVIGWILKYENKELETVVGDFDKGEKIFTKFHEEIITWNDISNLVFDFLSPQNKHLSSNKISCFAELWKRFSQDFLDSKNKDEYNSIKHGLRLGMNGYHFAAGPVENFDIPQEEQRYRSISNSIFGSSFFSASKINKNNYSIIFCGRNWNPNKFFYGINLVSESILAIILCLRKLNGENNVIDNFPFAEDENHYKKPWSYVEKSEFTITSNIKNEIPRLFTEKDIEFSYEKTI